MLQIKKILSKPWLYEHTDVSEPGIFLKVLLNDYRIAYAYLIFRNEKVNYDKIWIQTDLEVIKPHWKCVGRLKTPFSYKSLINTDFRLVNCTESWWVNEK